MPEGLFSIVQGSGHMVALLKNPLKAGMKMDGLKGLSSYVYLKFLNISHSLHTYSEEIHQVVMFYVL